MSTQDGRTINLELRGGPEELRLYGQVRGLVVVMYQQTLLWIGMASENPGSLAGRHSMYNCPNAGFIFFPCTQPTASPTCATAGPSKSPTPSPKPQASPDVVIHAVAIDVRADERCLPRSRYRRPRRRRHCPFFALTNSQNTSAAVIVANKVGLYNHLWPVFH